MNSRLVAIIISAVLLNFIVSVYGVPERTGNNVCSLSFQESGRTLGNGTQDKNGVCQETFMGEIPDFNHMVTTIIIFPKNNDVIEANRNFTFKQLIKNMNTGFFDDPAKEYYQFPQTLDKDGFIQGHSHVTIQKLDGEDQAPDPRVFAFFKGLNDEAIDDILSVEVGSEKKAGLDPGYYRACTMTASFGHQPTLMPVAQRGAQDDCVRFTVENGSKKKRSIKSGIKKLRRRNK
jgi:hypothetical protein